VTNFLQTASQTYGNQQYTRGQHGQSITMYDSQTHAPINFGADIIDFHWNETYKEINPDTISGKPKPISEPEMVTGTIRFLRYDGSTEQLFSDMRAAFFVNGAARIFNIKQIIAPPGCPASTINILGATIRFEAAGDYARGSAVELTVAFNASDWNKA
jgi:hypothetical protein